MHRILTSIPFTTPKPRRIRVRPVIGIALVTSCLAAGCASGGSKPANSTAESSPTLQTAPDSERVDLETPTFSDPTNITNPLFPISGLTQLVQVGSDAEGALRQEVTLLPETKTIEWDGQQIETVMSQFTAYGDGRIVELATDLFAQADDGSVWYFGEDVENYVDGVLDSTEGTWLAGKDGPPGMIMPADPQVGDVYRPENIPGLVFEEVVVKSVDETVDGPQGQITGALLVEEHPMDGAIEDKIFAPGYGEFKAQVLSEDELVNVSIGVPVDALAGGQSAEVDQLSAATADIYTAAEAQDWTTVSTLLTSVTTAWTSYRETGVPPLSADGMDAALEALRTAADTQQAAATQQAANELAYVVTDLRLRHEPPASVDAGRMDILARQSLLDAAAEEEGFVKGDITALEAVWSRISQTVEAAAAGSIEGLLRDLRAAAESADFLATTDSAHALREALAGL